MDTKAICTWGDGPDVLLNVSGVLTDLTTQQALVLSAQLAGAANRAMNLEALCAEHDAHVEMYLCETEHLVLKPQLYRFLIHPDCKRCTEMERLGDPSAKEDS